jgi:hypothetical protein
MEKCLDCGNIDNSHDCISILGVCGHGYHLHCISTWLKTKEMCPLDNTRWVYKKHEKNCNCNKKKFMKTNDKNIEVNDTEIDINTPSISSENEDIEESEESDVE